MYYSHLCWTYSLPPVFFLSAFSSPHSQLLHFPLTFTSPIILQNYIPEQFCSQVRPQLSLMAIIALWTHKRFLDFVKVLTTHNVSSIEPPFSPNYFPSRLHCVCSWDDNIHFILIAIVISTRKQQQVRFCDHLQLNRCRRWNHREPRVTLQAHITSAFLTLFSSKSKQVLITTTGFVWSPCLLLPSSLLQDSV